MSVKLDTRLRWFDQGAKAFASALKPDAPMTAAPRYVCPLCIDLSDEGRLTVRMFSRDAVRAGHLTAEHVPPRAFDGRELLLTCAPCNHGAGARLDAEARKSENPRDALTGRARRPVSVRLTAGDHTIPALLSTEGRMHTLTVPKHFRKEGVVEGFQAAIHPDNPGNRDIHINFKADAFREKHARTSWLRAAYLAMFAVLGYRYAFDPALSIVRRQIAAPDSGQIPAFLVSLPGDQPWTQRRLVRVRQPDWQQCWAVVMGRYAVFLPLSGDTGLYSRIGEAVRNGASGVTVTGDSYEWPTRPTFGVA